LGALCACFLKTSLSLLFPVDFVFKNGKGMVLQSNLLPPIQNFKGKVFVGGRHYTISFLSLYCPGDPGRS